MTKKNTQRALFASVISMLLCLTMLVGSTFAWFTDNASTNVNTIQAGTLDVDLLMLENGEWVDAEGKSLGFVDDEGNVMENILWEPGCSYLLQPFKIVNNGNLALKFDVVVSGIEGDVALAEAIEYGLLLGDVNNLSFVSYGNLNDFNNLFDAIEDPEYGSNVLEPEEELDTSEDGVTFHMKEEAGNEYQGLSISGLSITVRATQATVEEDSYSNQYDANAEYDALVNVHNQTELNDAVAYATAPVTLVLADGSYTLPNLNNKTVTISGSKNTVIDYAQNVSTNNADVTFDGVTVTFADNASYIGLQHAAKVVYKDCAINGTQFLYAPDVSFVNCTFTNLTNNYCVWTYGATKVNFTGCTFNTAGKAVLVYAEGETHATIDLDNCIFNDNNGANVKKGAVEVGSSPYSADTTYDIYMNNCTVNGFAVNDEGTTSTSVYWGNKNDMDKDHLNVVIDGVDVY